MASPSSSDHTLEIGQSTPQVGTLMLDNYLLMEHIVAGGMGDIFKAKDCARDQIVALKIVRTSSLRSNKEDGLRRVIAEAKITAALEHANIVKIFAVKLWNNLPVIIMEWLDGVNLATVLTPQNTPLEPKRFQKIFSEVANALQFAHERGVIHRDIKPENLMLCRDDAGYEITKIIDFGIAKDLFSEQQLTRTGSLLGTPSYMSPEQSQGRPLDARSDIYSLGCVMYQAVAGTPPFLGETALAVLHQQINDTVPDLKKEGYDEFAKIMALAMAKRPDDRYQSMQELKQDIINGLVSDKAKQCASRKAGLSKGAWSNTPSGAKIKLACVLVIGLVLVLFAMKLLMSQQHESEKVHQTPADILKKLNEEWELACNRQILLDTETEIFDDDTVENLNALVAKGDLKYTPGETIPLLTFQAWCQHSRPDRKNACYSTLAQAYQLAKDNNAEATNLSITAGMIGVSDRNVSLALTPLADEYERLLTHKNLSFAKTDKHILLGWFAMIAGRFETTEVCSFLLQRSDKGASADLWEACGKYQSDVHMFARSAYYRTKLGDFLVASKNSSRAIVNYRQAMIDQYGWSQPDEALIKVPLYLAEFVPQNSIACQLDHAITNLNDTYRRPSRNLEKSLDKEEPPDEATVFEHVSSESEVSSLARLLVMSCQRNHDLQLAQTYLGRAKRSLNANCPKTVCDDLEFQCRLLPCLEPLRNADPQVFGRIYLLLVGCYRADLSSMSKLNPRWDAFHDLVIANSGELGKLPLSQARQLLQSMYAVYVRVNRDPVLHNSNASSAPRILAISHLNCLAYSHDGIRHLFKYMYKGVFNQAEEPADALVEPYVDRVESTADQYAALCNLLGNYRSETNSAVSDEEFLRAITTAVKPASARADLIKKGGILLQQHQTRSQVVSSYLETRPFCQVLVRAFYQHFLGRDPEAQNWINVMLQRPTPTLLDFPVRFAATAEFCRRFKCVPQDYLREIFMRIVGRPPNPTERHEFQSEIQQYADYIKTHPNA